MNQFQTADILFIKFGDFRTKLLAFKFPVSLILMVTIEKVCGQKGVRWGQGDWFFWKSGPRVHESISEV